MSKQNRKPRAPVSETIGNKLTITDTLNKLNDGRAKLIDADKNVQALRATFGETLENNKEASEAFEKMANGFRSDAFQSCASALETLKTECRRGVSLIQEGQDYKMMAALAKWMLDNDIFPDAPEVKEDSK